MLDILEVATIGQAMSLYSSSASWFIFQLVNGGVTLLTDSQRTYKTELQLNWPKA